MKSVAAIVSIVVLVVSVTAMSMNFSTHQKIDVHEWNVDPFTSSRGYMMGYLTDTGMTGRSFDKPIKTLEGKLQLGYNSSNASVVDQECMANEEEVVRNMTDQQERTMAFASMDHKCRRVINPVAFSSMDNDLLEKVEKNTGSPVLLYYVKQKIVLWTDTHVIVRKMWAVRPDRLIVPLSMGSLSFLEFPISSWWHYKSHSIEGRVVQAEVVGNLRETYEIRIQDGPSGDTFPLMNVTSTPLFRYIIRCMASGKYLRLSYIQLYSYVQGPLSLWPGYATPNRVYKVEVIDPSSNVGS